VYVGRLVAQLTTRCWLRDCAAIAFFTALLIPHPHVHSFVTGRICVEEIDQPTHWCVPTPKRFKVCVRIKGSLAWLVQRCRC